LSSAKAKGLRRAGRKARLLGLQECIGSIELAVYRNVIVIAQQNERERMGLADRNETRNCWKIALVHRVAGQG
jgi:hypothetical protein